MPRKKDTRHASGLVEVKVTIGKTLDGKRVQKSFYGNSKLEAKRKAEEYKLNQEVANQTGDIFIKKEYTFGEWAVKWLETKKNTVKTSTYETTYKTKLDNYIIPYFGNAQLLSIRQIDIQNFFNNYSHMSKSTLSKLKIILKAIFDLAIDNDLCYKNPVKNIKLADNGTEERNVYSAKERDKLVEYCIQHNQIDILIFLKTGIRRSELIGLRWSDIDISNNTVHIQRAVTAESKEAVLGETKTKSSNRIIPFDNELKRVIKSNCKPTGYVLGGEQYLNPSSYGKRFNHRMEIISNELNIPALTPHELRHTYGTLLREQGVDIYTIQRVLGHSDISITAKIYVHNDIEVLRKNLNL